MIFYRACPKCHGELYLDRDRYGFFVKCLQCAFVKDAHRKEEVLRWLSARAEVQRKTV